MLLTLLIKSALNSFKSQLIAAYLRSSWILRRFPERLEWTLLSLRVQKIVSLAFFSAKTDVENFALNNNNNNNSKCRLCDDREETINHIISVCSKLAQKEYKTRHHWVGKVIHWEVYKNSNLTIWTNGICITQHLSKRMTRMGLWHTDGSVDLGQKTITNHNLQKNNNKKTTEYAKLLTLAAPSWPQNKTWKNLKRKISTWTLLGKLKKAMEREEDDYTNRDWCVWNSN